MTIAIQLNLFDSLKELLPPASIDDYDFGGAKEYFRYHEHNQALRLFEAVFNDD